MLRILIGHDKKNSLVPPTHLDDVFKSIGNTGLNSENRFSMRSKVFCITKTFQNMLKTFLR